MYEKILIVDDQPSVSEMINKVIVSNGMQGDIANSGEEALEKVAREHYALILMDINMQGMDGFETIKQLRKNGKTTPVIIVSDRREDIDTLYGLDIGADEYIVKPFNPVTLGARVKALIRRSKGPYASEEAVIVAGPFEYNTSTLRLFKNGKEIILTSKENAMMKLFLDNPNRIYSREALYELIWDNEVFDDNVIMVYINRLRSKIEDDPNKPMFIQNIRKVGYKFVVE
ncbi:MAG: response regulator transcription factor [Clostridiales bacterium]|nr:response regulator transcription factor [Candidatus Crickella equi]